MVALISPIFSDLGSHIKDLFNHPEGLPVKIDLVTQDPGAGETQAFSAPVGSSQLAALKSLNINSPQYEQWFVNHGAAPSGNDIITLVVQGNRDNPVQILSIKPIMTCHAPLRGTLFYFPSAGGEAITRLALDLDNPLATPGYFEGYGETNPLPDYFGHFKIPLTRGEQITLTVDASTARHYCEFTLDMAVLDGAHTLTETVSDNGQPFRVTAPLYNRTAGKYGTTRFTSYKTVYVYGTAYGGNTPTNIVAGWVRVNPATYKG